jgi:hypothetical protein
VGVNLSAEGLDAFYGTRRYIFILGCGDIFGKAAAAAAAATLRPAKGITYALSKALYHICNAFNGAFAFASASALKSGWPRRLCSRCTMWYWWIHSSYPREK